MRLSSNLIGRTFPGLNRIKGTLVRIYMYCVCMYDLPTEKIAGGQKMPSHCGSATMPSSDCAPFK